MQTLREWPGASPQRCGVCLFMLPQAAIPLGLDVESQWEKSFYTTDSRRVEFSYLDNSSRRGCSTCTSIIKFLSAAGITPCEALEWWPSRGFGGGMDMRPQLTCHVEDDRTVDVEVCTSPEEFVPTGTKVHPSICPGVKLLGSTGSKEAIAQAAGWLAECSTGHLHCQKGWRFAPTRLLDIGKSDTTIFLIENPSISVLYAALSHRWSAETAGTSLEAGNIERRVREGIALADLPVMMQDAIAVSRGLGLSFVWIDSLCIIQDSREDWLREALQMAKIYAHAELTIAAAWCHGSGQTLFSSREGNDFVTANIKPTSSTVDGSDTLFLRRSPPHFQWRTMGCSDNDSDTEFASASSLWPLLSRGWVYQEQWLSRRILYFTAHELVWMCCTTRACQCGWYRFGAADDQAAPTGGKLETRSRRWTDIVQEYSGRTFTKVGDRLPALAGIAQEYSYVQRSRGRYLCGLWEEDLPGALLWKLVSSPKMKTDLGLPSWSWVVVSGDVEFKSARRGDCTPEILDVEMTYDGSPFMGNVRIARLRICCRVVPATLSYDIVQELPLGEGNDGMLRDIRVNVGGRHKVFAKDYAIDSPSQHVIPSGTPILCLLFGSSYMAERDPEHPEINREGEFAEGLVLRCVGKDEDGADPARYERIGYFEGTDWDDGFDWERMVGLSEQKELVLV